jgi:PPOX class probable F420-dependent enzyme
MADLTPEQRAFLADNAFHAVLTTLREDGSPHSTVVWADEEGGSVLLNTVRGRAKERHMARDPRVSVTVVDPADGYRWLSVSGRVTMRDEDGVAVIERLSRKYLGTDYPWHKEGDTRVTAVLVPDRVDAYGL